MKRVASVTAPQLHWNPCSIAARLLSHHLPSPCDCLDSTLVKIRTSCGRCKSDGYLRESLTPESGMASAWSRSKSASSTTVRTPCSAVDLSLCLDVQPTYKNFSVTLLTFGTSGGAYGTTWPDPPLHFVSTTRRSTHMKLVLIALASLRSVQGLSKPRDQSLENRCIPQTR